MADKNEIDAITYKNCKEIKTNIYEKLTAEKAENDCRECAADHRQLAEWLTDYKGLRAEIIDLRLYVQMLEEYREKAKRLLKAAVEDFRFLESHSEDEEGNCLINYNGLKIDCKICPLNNAGICDPKIGCRWNHEAESLALIGEEGENNGTDNI